MKTLSKPRQRAIKALSNRFDGSTTAPAMVQRAGQKSITFVIKNLSQSPLRIALFAGLMNTIEEIKNISGMDVDFIAQEGAIKNADNTAIAEISCRNLDYVRRHLNNNPTIISSLQINAKDEVQLSQAITYKKVNPFKSNGETYFTPIELQSSSDSNTKLINAEVSGLVLGDQSLLMVDVAQGNHVTLTLYPEKSVDAFESLYEIENKSQN